MCMFSAQKMHENVHSMELLDGIKVAFGSL